MSDKKIWIVLLPTDLIVYIFNLSGIQNSMLYQCWRKNHSQSYLSFKLFKLEYQIILCIKGSNLNHYQKCFTNFELKNLDDIIVIYYYRKRATFWEIFIFIETKYIWKYWSGGSSLTLLYSLPILCLCIYQWSF